MTPILAFYFTTLFAVASLLMAYFKTDTFGPLVFHLLKKFGYKKNNEEFWNVLSTKDPLAKELNMSKSNPMEWDRQDYEAFLFANYPLTIASLLTCRYCLSFHLTFWVNIVGFFFFLGFVPLCLPPICIATQPFIVNWLFERLK